METQTKQCYVCAKEGAGPKPVTEFNLCSRRGHQTKCRHHAAAMKRTWREANRDEHRKSVRQWRKDNPEKLREMRKRSLRRRMAKNPERFRIKRRTRELRTKYGLSTERLRELFVIQNGLCGICFISLLLPKSVNSEKKTSTEDHVARVDHCHATGKIRGLLCMQCNLRLGHARDSVEWMRSAVEYLLTAQTR
jgi:hypothetical protein